VRWLRLGSLVLGAAALTWLVVHIGPADLWRDLIKLRWGLAAGCAFHLAGLSFDALALRALVVDEEPSRALALRASITGHAINEATPGGKLGEVTKFSVLEQAIPRDHAAAALVAQNLVMFIVNCALIAIAPWVTVLVVDGPRRTALGFAAIGVGFLIAAAVTLIVLTRGVGGWPFAVLRFLRVGRERTVRWRKAFGKIEKEWRRAAADRPGLVRAAITLVLSRLCNVAESALYFKLAGGAHWVAGGFLSLAGSQAVSWVTFFVPFQAGSGESGAYAVFAAAGLSTQAAVVVELARKLRRLVFIALGVVILGLTDGWHSARGGKAKARGPARPRASGSRRRPPAR
jgi:hypothetical protein